MAQSTAYGPNGVIIALINHDIELFGVRAKEVSSGRVSSKAIGYGDSGMTIFYVDGKRSSRAKATARIAEHVKDGDKFTIDSPLATFKVKI